MDAGTFVNDKKKPCQLKFFFQKVSICTGNLAKCWEKILVGRKKICYIFFVQFDAILARADGKADGMEQLIQVIKKIRQEISAYRKRPLKEDNTQAKMEEAAQWIRQSFESVRRAVNL